MGSSCTRTTNWPEIGLRSAGAGAYCGGHLAAQLVVFCSGVLLTKTKPPLTKSESHRALLMVNVSDIKFSLSNYVGDKFGAGKKYQANDTQYRITKYSRSDIFGVTLSKSPDGATDRQTQDRQYWYLQ